MIYFKHTILAAIFGFARDFNLYMASNKKKVKKAWNVSILFHIYKKGNIKNCNNYRGISLLYTSYKVGTILYVLFNKLELYEDEVVGKYIKTVLGKED